MEYPKFETTKFNTCVEKCIVFPHFKILLSSDNRFKAIRIADCMRNFWLFSFDLKSKSVQRKLLTAIGMLTQPRKSSCVPCLADWQTCLKYLPKPRTVRTSFKRDTASNTQLSSS